MEAVARWDAPALRSWLRAASPSPRDRFDPDSIATLPEPARRFLTAAIAPGTPLFGGIRITMDGEIRLKRAARFQPMQATQIIVPPLGMIWEVAMGRGLMRVKGHDAITPDTSWSAFRLWGVIPVARAGGTADHFRSSFGRLAADALFWLPTAFVPRKDAPDAVQWSAPAPDVARMTLRKGPHEQAVDLCFSSPQDTHPSSCVFDRWSNENPDRAFRLQPFGGTLSDWRDFGGLTLPTRVEAGNNWGRSEGFVFFRARVLDAQPF